MHDDKNCQSTKSLFAMTRTVNLPRYAHMWSVKPAMQQFSYKKMTAIIPFVVSVDRLQGNSLGYSLKYARKQIEHTVLPVYVQLGTVCKDSTSKCCYPSVSTHVCPDSVKMQSHKMWQVKAEPKKSQVNTRSQVQTSICKRDTKPQA